MVRLRSFFWLIKALVKRYHIFLFFGFLTGFLLFLSATLTRSFFSASFKQARVKQIGIIGSYTPTNFPLKIQQLLSFGLTDLTPSGEATSAAAVAWDVKEEGKLYVFQLKRQLFWQDGKEFKSGDINYNLKDAEISLIDDYTIKIKLKEPFSPLPVLLSQPLFKPGLVGLGRYKVSALEMEDNLLISLTLVPLPEFRDLSPLKYKFYPAEERAITAYKLGEIDVIEGLRDLSLFINWPVKVESQTMENWYISLFYNTEDSFLSQKPVRQVLTYALPSFPEGGISSPLNPHSWAYNNSLKKYTPDHELAKKLFKEMKTDVELGKRKLTISTTAEYENLAKQIAESWKDLDIEVIVKKEKDVPENFQVLLVVQEIPVDPDQYSLWHSTQKKTNISRYKNPRIDKLLEDGRKIVDRQERQKKYFDFQKYLLDDIPAAFLYHPVTYTISRH